ncbi:MAG: LPS assembly lipoprotein LptE [Planctomycetota bacterium]
MIRGQSIILALLAGTVVLASGCGYTMSSSLDTGETRTVRFTTVENRLFPFREGFEYAVTRRLKEEIATDARLEQVQGHADVILKVSLTHFEEPNLIEDTTSGDPAEVGLRVTAEVEAIGNDFVGGSVKRGVTVFQSYAPSLGESREAALTRLWRDLAREVLDLAADTEWSTP